LDERGIVIGIGLLLKEILKRKKLRLKGKARFGRRSTVVSYK